MRARARARERARERARAHARERERERASKRERERWMDERTEGSEAARGKAVKRPAPWGRRSC